MPWQRRSLPYRLAVAMFIGPFMAAAIRPREPADEDNNATRAGGDASQGSLAEGQPDDRNEARSRPAPESSVSPSRTNADRASVRSGIADFGLAVTVLGLLSYLLARYLVDGYLAPFNLSFDEIGLDYGKLVSSGAMFTIPSALLLWLTYRGVDNVWRKLAPRLANARSDAFNFIAGVILFILVSGLLFGLYLLLLLGLKIVPLAPSNQGSWGTAAFLALSIVFSSIIIALWFDSRGHLRTYWRRTVQRARQAPDADLQGLWRITGGLVASLALLCLLCFSAYTVGDSYADTVNAGKRLNVSILGLHLPAMAAKPVSVTTIDGARITGIPDAECLLLIGERGETLLLYDYRTGEIYRLSTQSVFSTERINADGCQ